MSIEVRTVDDADRWNELVADAANPTAFHLAEGLDVLAEYADADCHHLVGFKGKEPVGVFPVFTMSKGPVTAAFSPPPDLKVHYLGPSLLDRQEMKRRRRDKRNRRFVDACLDWLNEEHDPKFTTLLTPPGYDDVRPFVWQEFDAKPRYTYLVDLTRDREELLSAFSSDARRNVSNNYDVAYTLEEGTVEDAARVVEQVRARHEEQGEPFPLSTEFVTDLYERLPDGVVRPYVCRIDGEFAGGSVVLEYGDTSVCWLGGAKTDSEIPVNDLVDWHCCVEAMDRGQSAYDLAGANNARIAGYKAKFAPDLVSYYRLQNASRTMSALSKLYSRLK
ncbi:GNAT family N-acetyltransferase [Halobacterium litoreum]|uniref:GNAT family N-acetyltransferase n=1 Tax=Halobacterium litoreum TaxID=2039234 RepID=A0ABD5NB19_9EURY|nr:GNAT family N-acetyltransferase [Halobacterium litoreum]UHH14640.1 GNAT family N-acetyltransferase [Halobacterium litoreum]